MPRTRTTFKPGEGGRPHGATSKLGKTVRDTVLRVFNELQDDPKHNLAKFAQRYPRDFYAIAAKLIPQEIKGKVDSDQTIKLIIERREGNNTQQATSGTGEGAE